MNIYSEASLILCIFITCIEQMSKRPPAESDCRQFDHTKDSDQRLQ